MQRLLLPDRRFRPNEGSKVDPYARSDPKLASESEQDLFRQADGDLLHHKMLAFSDTQSSSDRSNMSALT